jgi:hypothetical protein
MINYKKRDWNNKENSYIIIAGHRKITALKNSEYGKIKQNDGNFSINKFHDTYLNGMK